MIGGNRDTWWAHPKDNVYPRSWKLLLQSNMSKRKGLFCLVPGIGTVDAFCSLQNVLGSLAGLVLLGVPRFGSGGIFLGLWHVGHVGGRAHVLEETQGACLGKRGASEALATEGRVDNTERQLLDRMGPVERSGIQVTH
jgi:hypothetical protein